MIRALKPHHHLLPNQCRDFPQEKYGTQPYSLFPLIFLHSQAYWQHSHNYRWKYAFLLKCLFFAKKYKLRICINFGVRIQIITSRLIETLRFFSIISVSNKHFACAVFGIHLVKVLPSDNDFSLSAAHFLYWNCLKLSVSIKKWNRKNLPRPFVSIVYPFVSTVRPFVSKVWFIFS